MWITLSNDSRRVSHQLEDDCASLEKALVNSPGDGLSVHFVATDCILRTSRIFFRSKHIGGVHDWVYVSRWSHIEHRYFGHRRGFGTQVNYITL